jgi:hypothetical protein
MGDVVGVMAVWVVRVGGPESVPPKIANEGSLFWTHRSRVSAHASYEALTLDYPPVEIAWPRHEG